MVKFHKIGPLKTPNNYVVVPFGVDQEMWNMIEKIKDVGMSRTKSGFVEECLMDYCQYMTEFYDKFASGLYGSLFKDVLALTEKKKGGV